MSEKSKKKNSISDLIFKNPDAIENELINCAVSLAYKKLKEGTASSQIIVHFLKLATEKERLENEKLRMDLKVSEAKIHQLESQSETAKIYEDALAAFKSYIGLDGEEDA